jgi:hypothetical protein
MYVEKLDELYDSLFEFNEKPEFWRAALGAAPRYFVHTQSGGRHYFGMSKFCVLKDISIEEYISNYRYITDGNNSQLIIKNRFERSWIPRENIDNKIRVAFDNWILEFFPNYSINNANFISLPERRKIPKQKKIVSPEELEEILDLKSRIGRIGETIAFKYEIERLATEGFKNSSKYVKHVAASNTTSGFDISSITRKEERFIEVKSSLSQTKEFYISENEVLTLERLGSKAFIYFVVVDNIENMTGTVYKIIKDPINIFRNKNLLQPIMYKVKL